MRQYDVTPNLVHLLKDEVEEVRANAAGALMSALVTTEGEAACGLRIWVGGVPPVWPPSVLATWGVQVLLALCPPKYSSLQLLKSFQVGVQGPALRLLPGAVGLALRPLCCSVGLDFLPRLGCASRID